MITTIINALFAGLSLLFALLARQYMLQTKEDLNSASSMKTDLKKLSMNVSVLENEFADKFDYAMRKMASRKAMREKRDMETEDSNTPNVLVPI